MAKIFLFFVIALLAMTQAYSQCACCAGAGTGSSGSDYNNGILTLSKNQFTIEGYADYRTIRNAEEHGSSADPTEEDETPLKSMLINYLGVRYGVTNTITLSALLPYTFLYTDKGNDKGIGDLMLLGAFNIYSRNNFNLALQAGVELPTGTQKGANFDNTTVVVGSGSVDPMAGILVSKRFNRFVVQGNALYKYTTQGFERNNYGSLSVQNLSLTYRLKGESDSCSANNKDHTKHYGLTWTLHGGYYGEWLDNIKEKGVINENTGYYLGFATLGTNISYKNWSFPITLSLPVIQGMNGDQNNAGFRLRAGIIKSF